MSARSSPGENNVAAFEKQTMSEVLQHKLLMILHRACCEIRTLSQTDQQERIFELADTVEFIPEEMRHWRAESLNLVRDALRQYQKKYSRLGVDYLADLEMDDAEFDRRYINPPPPDLNDPQVREFIYGPDATNHSAGKPSQA